MAETVRLIQLLTRIYMLACLLDGCIAIVFNVADRQASLSSKLQNIVYIALSGYGICSIALQRSVIVYLSLLLRNIFTCIERAAQQLMDDRSPNDGADGGLPVLEDILIIYRFMEEIVDLIERVVSPLLTIQILGMIPSIITYMPVTDRYERSARSMFLMSSIVSYIIFIVVLMVATMPSIDYCRPYEAVYRLSFDCGPRYLAKVSDN